MEKYWELAIVLIAAVGGWQFVRYVLNINSNRRISAAEAYREEYKALIEDYKRVQDEVDKLNRLVDDLYKRVHALEGERLDLIRENNELRLQLKESEKHVCWRPTDECFQRLIESDHCLYRKLIKGVKEQHPHAIVTKEDMKKGVTENGKDNGIPEKPDTGKQS